MAGRDDARSGSGACQARRPRLLRPRLALGSCRRLHRRWAGSGPRLGERPQPLADRLSTRSRRDPLVLLTVAGRVTRRVGLLPPLAVAALLSAPVAVAARPPTLSERAAITRALPAHLRNTPTECVWLDVKVSRNPRYALVSPLYLNATAPGSRCLRYASNG